MRKYKSFIVLGCSLFLLGSISAFAQQPVQPQWPEITQEAKPWTRWWWMGSAVNQQDLSHLMEQYKEAGLGGLEITPIYGVKGYEDQFIDFLSPKWMEMLTHTLKEGERLDIGVDMAQASGWPFGGPWVTQEDACNYIAHKEWSLDEGQTLEEPVEYIQEPLVRAIGEDIAITELKEPVAENPNLQLHAFDQVRFEKPLPLQTLMAYSDSGETLDLTEKVDENGKLNWTAPPGKWELFGVFLGWHGKMVERAGPGGEGDVIDHFSEQATTNYLKRFDEAFKVQGISGLRAFFNDSYEVDDAFGEANWTPRMFEEFQARRGYDLRKYLPALFGKDTEENNRRVLSDYRETISDLLLNNFTRKWHEWGSSHNALIRNQAHGSPANILDLYAATDIPEIEGRDIQRIKFASSAANVTGKKLISSESATWENEHFLSSLRDVKSAMDLFLLGGVNHTFYHGTNYSPPEEAWPGWLFYAAVHFNPNNTFWNDFAKLNTYVARSQSFLQSGNPDNDILLYLPIYDAFAAPGNSLLQHFDGLDHGFRGSGVEESAQEMYKRGFSYDFISDRQLLQVEEAENNLVTGGNSYKTILIPDARLIPLETFQKLFQLAEEGANIAVFKNLPREVPGLGNREKRQNAYKELIGQLNFQDTDFLDVKRAKIGDGAFFISDEVESLLNSAEIERERLVDQGLQYIRRKKDDEHYYFLVNQHDEPFQGWITLEKKAEAVAVYNPMTGETGFSPIRKATEEQKEVYVQIAPQESIILEIRTGAFNGVDYPFYTTVDEPTETINDWTLSFIDGGPELPPEREVSHLQSWTELGGEEVKNFSGTAKYTASFGKPEKEAEIWLLDLGQVEESARVVLNGKMLDTLIGPSYHLTVPGEMLKGNNKLEVYVSNSMANRAAYLDRNNITWKKFYNINIAARRSENWAKKGGFTAANWEPRASGLLGPVRLVPIQLEIQSTTNHKK